jgi:hypothetical protein
MTPSKSITNGIELIKDYFQFLFRDGFQIVKKYDHLEFGNWIVILGSEKGLIRFIKDREEIFIRIAPSWASISIDQSQHYIDLSLLVNFLTKTEAITLTVRKSLEMTDQFKTLRSQFHSHYSQIISVLTSNNFSAIEDEIKMFQQRQIRKAFPNIKFQKD